MKKRKISEKTRIRATFIVGVAIILLIAIVLVYGLQLLLVALEVYANFVIENSIFEWVLMFAIISIVLGLGLTFVLERIILKPINILLDGMKKLSDGEFSTRIDLGKMVGMQGLAEKFNTLASELQKIEILRSDFVNNFSHELKTPVVSISSLIALMKKSRLSKDKQMQYLNIIEEEISRLSEMTTNILNLSRIENQSILTDKRLFNLSEQVRTCILLLEKKWEKKHLELDVDFDEYYVIGNEDMLKQVWINLIDNAVKFSKKEGKLKVSIEKEGKQTVVKVTNEGVAIPEEDYQKVFYKFYQGQNSNKKEGNGIGLSIVKHIVDLHEGEISVVSENGLTTFTVKLNQL
ncbi:MAG: HAMP domain-containing histidine kinase [Clostridia bacterium]|nr:HAMP domain-containing histidine kinase [Clostridia bacterium]